MIDALAACAAVLLVVSGLAKLRRPAPAAAMLAALTRRRSEPVARLAGAFEVAVGLLALALGGRVGFGALAMTYVVLAVVASRLLVTGQRANQRVVCGCFGSSDAPIGPAHLALDVGAALLGALAAGQAAPAFAGLGARPAPLAVAAGLQIAVLSWLAYLAVTELPALAARRRALTDVST